MVGAAGWCCVWCTEERKEEAARSRGVSEWVECCAEGGDGAERD